MQDYFNGIKTNGFILISEFGDMGAAARNYAGAGTLFLNMKFAEVFQCCQNFGVFFGG